jgi:Glucodextranase, domain B/Bacterial Ig-like domain
MGFCVSAVLAGRADATLTTSHLPSEAAAVAAAQANGGAIRFTGEARIGHGNDWNLGMRRLPGDTPAATARFNGWPNGSPLSFTLSSDGRQTVSLTLAHAGNHSTLTYTADGLADLTDLFVSARAVNSGTSTTLAGLTLDGVPVGDAPVAASTGTEAQDVLRIQGGALAGGFTLNGTIILRWRGAKPQGSDLRALFWGARTIDQTADTQPPVIAFTTPAAGSLLAAVEPTIAATYSDSGSGIDPASVHLLLDGTDRTAEAQVTGSGLTFTPSAPLADGGHTAQVTVRDRAGNQAQAAVSFTTDTVPPAIVFTSPSTEGGFVNSAALLVTGTVSDASPVVSVQINGTQVPFVNGMFQSTITLVDGVNEVLINAQDAAGNQGIASRFVTLDTTPPELQVKTPSSGQIVNASEIQVTGQATDDRELAEVTVQGDPVPVSADLFAAAVPVTSGDNLISVRAVDRAGNETIVNVPVNRFDLPDVTITSPADLSFLRATAVDVSGTVSDPQARVTVNGVSATVSGTVFTAPGVPLIEGGNILTATATDAHGHVATGSINVVRDLTPPHLAVQYPPDGSVVFDPTVTVTGLVNDIVAGTVNAAQATVTVNGLPATVANRSFVATGVPLSLGDNLLSVVATDASGNTGEARATVRFEAPSGPRISIVSGNLQENVIGTALPQPLGVTLLDAAGQPSPGRTVLFKVRGNDGSLDGGKRQIALVTDASGQAAAHFTLGLRAGAANQAVEASSAGFQGPAVFLATARPGPPTYLVVDSGDQQVGIAGRLLPRPLVAVVTDRGYNRLEGIAVRFNVTQGRGHFENGLQEALTFSDSDGRLILPFALDSEEGIANNIVEAKIDGLDSSPVASFAASGRAAGDPAATSISGVVLDNASQPLAGVTLRVLDTALTARTDEKGLFKIASAPVGTVKLIVDGSTVERPGTWPDLEYALTTIPGRDNTVNMPIYLLPLDQHNGLLVDETHGGVLTLPEVPGFSLEVAPGSVTFPGGSRSGVVSVTVVHNDRVPMVPNFGQQPRLIVTIQPAGARFDPPARLTLPNVEGLTPGAVTEMYSFDHDLGHFVSIGPATVSEDGSVITSNVGVGVIKAGWHCCGNPAGTGTPNHCDDCLKCDGVKCVPDTGALCRSCTPGTGKACDGEGHCRTGRELIPIRKVCDGMGIQEGVPEHISCSQVPQLNGARGLCGAAIRLTHKAVTHKCDSVDMDGAAFTETVTSDFKCTGGGDITQSDGRVFAGNLFVEDPSTKKFNDYYYLCPPPDLLLHDTCQEIYTQEIKIDGCPVATHHIVFKITRTESGCTGEATYFEGEIH